MCTAAFSSVTCVYRHDVTSLRQVRKAIFSLFVSGCTLANCVITRQRAGPCGFGYERGIIIKSPVHMRPIRLNSTEPSNDCHRAGRMRLLPVYHFVTDDRLYLWSTPTTAAASNDITNNNSVYNDIQCVTLMYRPWLHALYKTPFVLLTYLLTYLERNCDKIDYSSLSTQK